MSSGTPFAWCENCKKYRDEFGNCDCLAGASGVPPISSAAVLRCAICAKAIDPKKGYYNVGEPNCLDCGEGLNGDRPWWSEREPNFARLQMSVCRREVLLGRDEVMKLNESKPEKTV